MSSGSSYAASLDLSLCSSLACFLWGWMTFFGGVFISLYILCIIGFCFVVTIRLTYNKYTRDKNKGIYIYY